VLNSKAVLDLAMATGTPGIAGRVAAIRRFHSGTGMTTGLPPRQQRLVQDVQAVPPVATGTYNHPGAGVTAGAPGRGPLTASEIAWLQTLPTDPERMPFDDARALAQLTADLSSSATLPGQPKPERNPGDLRLLHAVFDPVAEYHDANAAEVAFNNAAQPLPQVPASALGALAEAVGAEQDQLQPDEALTRAGNMLSDALAQREASRSAAIAVAQQRLEAALAAPVQRTSTMR
jgi:hypothetical protein